MSTTNELQPSLLPGVNVLIEGPTGTGKTYSLGTIADSGVETFVLFVDNSLETLLGYYADKNKPVPENLHWHILPKATNTFADLAEGANMINTYSQDTLYKYQDSKRHVHNQFITLLKALADFPDDRTGKKFGPVDSWGPDRCLVLSTLSGINPVAMSLVIGNKPIKSQVDWGIAQDQIIRLLRQLVDGCRCHFVLEAHIERETNPVSGALQVTVATLGRALAPQIPPLFSDVIMTKREGASFYWSTAESTADLKTRNLPIAEKIKPDFGQIFDKWKSRGGSFSKEIKK